MAHHIFQLEGELQKIPEAAPKASPSFSVSEKLARYGSSALDRTEVSALSRQLKLSIRQCCQTSQRNFERNEATAPKVGRRHHSQLLWPG
jgi:hypothetical protein